MDNNEHAPFNGIPNCRHSAETDKIFPALVEALPKIAAATKDAVNPHLKNRYADLSSFMDVARGPLADAGIAIMQPPSGAGDDCIMVATVLLHKSGQWIASELMLKAVDTRAQSIGSAITYARRYGLAGMLGIVADDDDGNQASGVVGSKEAARNVANRKLAEMREPPPAQPTPPKSGKVTPNFKALQAFGILHEEFKALDAELDYYGILGKYHYKKSNEIPAEKREEALAIHHEMKARLNELKIEAQGREAQKQQPFVASDADLPPGLFPAAKEAEYPD